MARSRIKSDGKASGRTPWGARIAAARKAAGFSQSALAGRIGGSQSAITDYERGESEPDFATVERIAMECGVEPGWLIFGSGGHPDDGDPLAGAAIQRHKHDRIFGFALVEAAKLLSSEGLETDLAFLVAYAKKLTGRIQRGTNDAKAREIILSALERERQEVRSGLDQLKKDRL